MSDPTKWQFRHFPMEALEPICRALQEGSEKYGYRNWEYELQPRDLVDAMMRHLKEASETGIDPETGIHHAAYMAANAIIICAMLYNGPFKGTKL